MLRAVAEVDSDSRESLVRMGCGWAGELGGGKLGAGEFQRPLLLTLFQGRLFHDWVTDRDMRRAAGWRVTSMALGCRGCCGLRIWRWRGYVGSKGGLTDESGLFENQLKGGVTIYLPPR